MIRSQFLIRKKWGCRLKTRVKLYSKEFSVRLYTICEYVALFSISGELWNFGKFLFSNVLKLAVINVVSLRFISLVLVDEVWSTRSPQYIGLAFLGQWALSYIWSENLLLESEVRDGGNWKSYKTSILVLCAVNLVTEIFIWYNTVQFYKSMNGTKIIENNLATIHHRFRTWEFKQLHGLLLEKKIIQNT